MEFTPPDDSYDVNFLPECLNELEKFGPLEELDAALSEVMYALRKNPHAFKASPEHPNWIVVITRRHMSKNRVVPSLRLYAAINDDEKVVLIVDVKINPDDRSLYM